jgi:predicted RecA/RadA family phage recombinase
MAKNYRGRGERTTVIAAAPRSSGAFLIEQQLHGVAYTTTPDPNAYGPDNPNQYGLMLEGEFEIPFITSAAVGDTVYMGTTTFALARVATGAAAPTIGGNAAVRPVAKVMAVPGNGPDSAGKEPAAGFMWVKLLPQPA